MSSKLKHLGSRSCLVAFTFTTYESKERDSVQALPLLSLSFSRTAAPLFALHCMHALNANQTKPLSLSLSLSLFYAIFNSHAVLQFFFFRKCAVFNYMRTNMFFKSMPNGKATISASKIFSCFTCMPKRE